MLPSLPWLYFVIKVLPKNEDHMGAELCLECSRDLLLSHSWGPGPAFIITACSSSSPPRKPLSEVSQHPARFRARYQKGRSSDSHHHKVSCRMALSCCSLQFPHLLNKHILVVRSSKYSFLFPRPARSWGKPPGSGWNQVSWSVTSQE